MSPFGVAVAIGMMILGGNGPRFWWKGLALTIAIALVEVCFATILMMDSPDPLAQGASYSFDAKTSVGAAFGAVLGNLFWYGIGAGIVWLRARFRR